MRFLAFPLARLAALATRRSAVIRVLAVPPKLPRSDTPFPPLRRYSHFRAFAGTVDDADFQTLGKHGFSDEDVWDIAAITAFFGLSNRMANMIGMRPNDEFYLMGRVPRGK